MTAERDHRQAQASRPTFRALVQRGHPGVGQADPGRGKQLARLALGEPQIAGPDLGDLVGKPELVQPDRRIPARRQHHARRARQNREQTLELRQRLSRPQLVEIVDDQHDGFDLLGDLRQDPVDHLVAVERSGAAGCVSGSIERAGLRIASRTAHQNRCASCWSRSTDTNATRRRLRRAVGPRTQQRGLPTSRRRRDDRHPPGHGAIQQLEEVFPVEQAPGDRDVSSRSAAPGAPRAASSSSWSCHGRVLGPCLAGACRVLAVALHDSSIVARFPGVRILESLSPSVIPSTACR